MVNLKAKYVALRLNARNAIKKMRGHCMYIIPALFVQVVQSYSSVNASELHYDNINVTGDRNYSI